LENLFNFRSWGTIGVGMIAVIILTLISKPITRQTNWFIWSISIISILLVIGMYYVFSFDNT
jgi:hypothetical protein